jgi:hypothetical protein
MEMITEPPQPDVGTSADAVLNAYMEGYRERVAVLKSAPIGGSGALFVIPLILSRIGHFGFEESHAIAFAREVGRLRGAHFLAIENASNSPAVLRVLHEVTGQEFLRRYIGDLAVLVTHAIAGINRQRF